MTDSRDAAGRTEDDARHFIEHGEEGVRERTRERAFNDAAAMRRTPP
ncbi:MAG: hypothetical protein OXQ28_05365 [Acidobacteriota bacterium]|nr:hypothetical protein [Acidobacteriota bacterium]